MTRGALAFPTDQMLAVVAHLLSLAAVAVEGGTPQTALIAHILRAGHIVTLATAMPFGIRGTLKGGAGRTAGAVPLARTQAEDLSGASAGQASRERTIRPCQFVSIDGEAGTNAFHWDLLRVREVRAQEKNQTD